MKNPIKRILSPLSNIKEKKILRGKIIIHDNKNAIRIAAFISIPKNASNTIREILELGPNRGRENTTSLVIYENHQRAEVLNQKYDLSKLFVFCFSRNPYDRCVSWYESNKGIEPYKSLEFTDWIKQGMPHHWKLQNQTNFVSTGISPLLQYNFVEQYKVDFLGKMETFSTDLKIVVERLNHICEQKGLSHRFRYTNKKRNKSIRNPEYKNYYNQETREIVYSLLKKDFHHFGYKKWTVSSEDT